MHGGDRISATYRLLRVSVLNHHEGIVLQLIAERVETRSHTSVTPCTHVRHETLYTWCMLQDSRTKGHSRARVFMSALHECVQRQLPQHHIQRTVHVLGLTFKEPATS